MYYVSLLVIDLGRVLGPAFRQILESSPFHGTVYLKQPFHEIELESYREYLTGVFNIFKFDMALTIFPQEFQDLIALQDWIRQAYLTHTLFAFIESSGSGKAPTFTAILENGEKVALPVPPKASIILPYLWRMVGRLHNRSNPFHILSQEEIIGDLIGDDPAFLEEVRKIPLAAMSNSNVFISGATGTGKKSFAKKIHSTGLTAGRPLAYLCCEACTSSLGKKDFLGTEYPTGEFIVNSINGGTLLLDEIGSLPLTAQINLLDFLESKTNINLSQSRELQASFRVIACSTQHSEEILSSGKLLKNLYYRLNIISFKLLLLKERARDIRLLADYFLRKFSWTSSREASTFTPEAVKKLLSYDWPGNVRELEYTIRRAVNLQEGDTIRESDIKLPIETRGTVKKSI
ncbi:MAG: sigma 54-interacting transcriptional regulator, partial [Syntrophobacteraceae bacterium]